MPDQQGGGYTTNELARLYADSVRRMESLASRLEGGQFVSFSVFTLNNEKLDLRFQQFGTELKNLQDEIDSLKDDRKWLVRLLVAFIIMSILGVVFVTSGGGVAP